jgi:DNA polymerase-3 subunit chi
MLPNKTNKTPKAGSTPAGSSGSAEQDQRYWFHILAQSTPAARNVHAARLADKAWRQGDRVCILCDTEQHAKELDDLLWSFSPDAFIPHKLITGPVTPGTDPVGILSALPLPSDWDTVIVLSSALPANAYEFKRLALIAHNNPQILKQARGHFRQLRAMGIEPCVHDQRK